MNPAEYIILDAARMDGLIFKAKELNERHSCLYEGDSERFLSTVAPWMFQLERESPFAYWLLSEGKEKNWNLVVIKADDGQALYDHLRKFLIVNTQEEKELYFRYYEPNVLQAFLPTCDVEQLIEFFGPVRSFVLAEENGNMLEFKLQKSELVIDDLQCDIRSYIGLRPTSEMKSDMQVSSTTPIDPTKTDNEKWDFGF